MSHFRHRQRGPLAAPLAMFKVADAFASSQERHMSLWDGRFWRITPGALSPPLYVLLSLAGGRT